MNNKLISINCNGEAPVATVMLSQEIKVEIDPKIFAQLFWCMRGDQQVTFINELAYISGHKLAFQLQFISDNKNLSLDGRSLMRMFGEYSEKEEA